MDDSERGIKENRRTAWGTEGQPAACATVVFGRVTEKHENRGREGRIAKTAEEGGEGQARGVEKRVRGRERKRGRTIEDGTKGTKNRDEEEQASESGEMVAAPCSRTRTTKRKMADSHGTDL